ncbi:hypothetical protein ILP92_12195 [Maribius pontilimi]|uniref:Uncharacterized protein n=1 Tax=Palleronia pontilimi TaxID=1964209 RepID=A0A934IFN0_9RHOB|nr:hypothetical protein [Palleronia pontilimi]MBJ3763507.1 hypothetical protein [Palleronia pontilimi]
MPDLIWIEYSLRIERKTEITGDEPRFEFFFLNVIDGEPHATVVDTGIIEVNMSEMNSPVPTAGASDMHLHPPIPPSEADPYLGMAVRAYEYDDTTAAQRRESQDATLARIEEQTRERLRGGERPPGPDTFWQIVSRGVGVSRRGDEDEHMGHSARVYPRLGRELVRDGIRRTIAPAGGAEDDMLRFGAHGGRWRMPFFMTHQSL